MALAQELQAALNYDFPPVASTHSHSLSLSLTLLVGAATQVLGHIGMCMFATTLL